MQIKTSNPHLPYQTPNDETGEMTYGNSLPDNYINSIKYVDRHIGKFIHFLKNRKRKNNTIIIITGDHSNYIDQSKISPLPDNDTVWTSSLIYGPPNIVGKPGKINLPASHVDLNPTILAMAGDKRPTASLGRNLLENSNDTSPFAITICISVITKGNWRTNYQGTLS
jgi:arylsulfatase A-like enzyme